MKSKNHPLGGLLVIEMASVLAGPALGMFLAELGATVIKVENPAVGGDVTRKWLLETENEEDISAYFSSVNWGKQSVALDIAHKPGREILYGLVKKADIFLSSFKPGDAQKLKTGYGDLSALNPSMIYLNISGFGENDPRPGYDAIVQAESGFMFMNGTPGSGPVKMPVALMDILASHQAKEAVLLALLNRQQTGKGDYLTVSLIDAAVAALANQASNYLQAGHIPQRMGSEHPNIAPYGNIFPTKDGKLVILAIGTDRQFQALCEILKIDHQGRFSNNYQRVKNREELNLLLKNKIAQQNSGPFLKTLASQNIPAGQVKNLKEVLGHDRADKMIFEEEGLSAVRTVAFESTSFSKRNLSPPPRCGEHTASILSGYLNMDRLEIQKLREHRTII